MGSLVRKLGSEKFRISLRERRQKMIKGDTDTLVYTVDDESKGMELYDILRQHLHVSSRLIRKCKLHKDITVNNRVRSMNGICNKGEVIRIYMKPDPNIFEAQEIPIQIIYEDMDLIVVNKPSGVVVHPTKRHQDMTIGNALAFHAKQNNETYKIRFVNRLDRDTTGLLIIAKNGFAQQFVSDRMQLDEVEKTYLALVEGVVKGDSGTINAPIGRENIEDIIRIVTPEGKESITHYEVVERFERATLVKIRLETGRTHQIRVHMKHLGHVLVGDTLYGTTMPEIIERQALQAVGLKFETPRNGVVDLKVDLTEDIKKAIELLRS